MYTLCYKDRFIKRLSKIMKKHPLLQKKIDKTLNYLIENPFYPSLKTHKVHLKYDKKEAFSVSVNGNFRIAWRFSSENLEILDIEDIGTHSGTFQIYTKKS